MTTLERDIERKLTELVKQHGGLCLKWVCPGWSGVPDRIVLLPGRRIIFVELKRPKGGRFSAMQRWWAKKLTDLGFNYWALSDNFMLEMFENTELRGTES
jgi:hypothetical protein